MIFSIRCKPPRRPQSRPKKAGDKGAKKKAGFYLSVALLERFNRKFHELNLSGMSVENKSALLEAALSFALDDMDKGRESVVLDRWIPGKDIR